MERSREARKAPMAAPNGATRRRHRGSGIRDSPDEDGSVVMQEAARLRERERYRERSSRKKRSRGDRLIHAGKREDVHDDSTDESVNDEIEEDYEEDGGGSLRIPPPNPASTSSPSLLNHQRKSFPQPSPSTKMFRPPSPWKPVDEMIGVPIPRKARSASTKRAHECWVSGSSGLIGGDQVQRQASTSPSRSSLVSAAASPLRMSPPSNISIHKKMKGIGLNKQRNTPKASTSKTTSSNQDEIEFEIAEVLYGMMTQAPDVAKAEGDVNELLVKLASDSKSRVSSPVSAAAPHLSSTGLLLNSGSSVMAATVPKRKKPRPVNYGDAKVDFPSGENFIQKSELDPVVKAELRSTVLVKKFKQASANGMWPDLEQSRDNSLANPSVVMTLPVKNHLPEYENLRAETTGAGTEDVDAISNKRDSPLSRFDENSEQNVHLNSRPTATRLGIKHEKFQIDLMAAPPASRVSPDWDGDAQNVSSEPKKLNHTLEELKPVANDAAAAVDSRNSADPYHKRFDRSFEVHRRLQLGNLENKDAESGMKIAGAGKQEVLNQHQQAQAQPQVQRIHAGDKTVPATSSLPSAVPMPGWQGGLPPLGYMTPLQGVVSVEGSTISATPLPPHMLLNQPRPKKCATHCYIARSISCHQQFTRMNPFWPAAGNAAALYGANACNLNVVPPVEMHCSAGARGVNPILDKSLGVFPAGGIGKDKPSQALNIPDTQRKRILLQQSVSSGVPGNLLQGPAFIFPLSQQQAAAAAASALTATMKNPPVAGALSTVNPNSGPGGAQSADSATMSFNYQNMTTNETQYLAILQNNPYQLPFPTHAGAPPIYRGAHPQAMPAYNGRFFSPQMLHPQLQQQPQQASHGHQVPQGQNVGFSSGSSSQKQLQNHSQKSQDNESSAGTPNIKLSYPSPKIRPSNLPLKQHNQQAGVEGSPTADSRGTLPNFGLYTEGLNFPIHTQNFALISASSQSANGGTATNSVTNGNHHKNGNLLEKKLHQQQQGLKVGVDSLTSHKGFAVSFASLNGDGGPPAVNIPSMGQNHAILHNFADPSRHPSYQVMVAHQAQQNKMSSRISDEVKKASGGDASNVEDERQSMISKGNLSNAGLSIALSRSDMVDSSSPGNNVVDSTTRNVKVSSGSGRAPGPFLATSITNTQQQLPHHQQQPLQTKAQFIQLHKQPQQHVASETRGKTLPSGNGNVYLDQLPTNGAPAAKLTNSLSSFQQTNAQMSGGGNSPTQSQQWKNSAHSSISQVSSTALAPTNSASAKNLYQQQSHRQISFGGGNQKSLSGAQGQQPSAGHQNTAQTVGSAAASLNHRNGGSPRTPTASVAGMVPSKAPHATTLSPSASFQVKNSAMPSRNSSPVGARSVPPPGNSNMCMAQGNSCNKPQMYQQQQQQMKQLSKQPIQQAQYPSYLQTSQGPNQASSTSSVAAANSDYLERRRSESQQSVQQSQSPSGTSSTGILSMCSSSIAISTDPAKLIAAVAGAGNSKKAPSK